MTPGCVRPVRQPTSPLCFPRTVQFLFWHDVSCTHNRALYFRNHVLQSENASPNENPCHVTLQVCLRQNSCLTRQVQHGAMTARFVYLSHLPQISQTTKVKRHIEVLSQHQKQGNTGSWFLSYQHTMSNQTPRRSSRRLAAAFRGGVNGTPFPKVCKQCPFVGAP